MTFLSTLEEGGHFLSLLFRILGDSLSKSLES